MPCAVCGCVNAWVRGCVVVRGGAWWCVVVRGGAWCVVCGGAWYVFALGVLVSWRCCGLCGGRHGCHGSPASRVAPLTAWVDSGGAAHGADGTFPKLFSTAVKVHSAGAASPPGDAACCCARFARCFARFASFFRCCLGCRCVGCRRRFHRRPRLRRQCWWTLL
jgi:hypothetical protein